MYSSITTISGTPRFFKSLLEVALEIASFEFLFMTNPSDFFSIRIDAMIDMRYPLAVIATQMPYVMSQMAISEQTCKVVVCHNRRAALVRRSLQKKPFS